MENREYVFAHTAVQRRGLADTVAQEALRGLRRRELIECRQPRECIPRRLEHLPHLEDVVASVAVAIFLKAVDAIPLLFITSAPINPSDLFL